MPDEYPFNKMNQLKVYCQNYQTTKLKVIGRWPHFID